MKTHIVRHLSTWLPAPPPQWIEQALREALPACEALPVHLREELLIEDAEEDSFVEDTFALPRRPFVRDLSHTLLHWRARQEFPWPTSSAPSDLADTDDREAVWAHATPAVLVLTLWPSRTRALAALEQLGPWGVLALLRCRRTVGTIMRSPPSPVCLHRAFVAPHRTGGSLTVGARALTKHWHRSSSSYWGTDGALGNDDAKNSRALGHLRRLFQSACWINIHAGAGDGDGVFEIRQIDGYGMRWSVDGRMFRGFLEPQAWDVQRRRAQSAAQDAALSHAPESVATVDEPADPMTPSPADTRAAAASLSSAPSDAAVDGPSLVEALGLQAALSPDGRRITVAGYASLMDAVSARETNPSLGKFRYGTVDGWCRVFALVSIVNVKRGVACGRHLATATARPRDGRSLHVGLYEVDTRELPALLLRERRLRVSCVAYRMDTADGAAEAGSALMFTEYSDAEYFRERCRGDSATWEEEVGQYYRGRLYREDLYPVPSYLLRCLRAHRLAGPAALANFLETSYLGDGVTGLMEHIEAVLRSPPRGTASMERGQASPAPRADEAAEWSRCDLVSGRDVTSRADEAAEWSDDERVELCDLVHGQGLG